VRSIHPWQAIPPPEWNDREKNSQETEKRTSQEEGLASAVAGIR